MADSVSSFGLAYYGDAVAEGSMAVRDLAPALLALGEVYTRANAILNGDRSSVTLNFRATNRGSFDVLLALAIVSGPLLNFLSGQLVTSAANLKELILGSDGLFAAIKQLRGQDIKPPKEPQAGINIEINNSTININLPPEVIRLYSDREIRRLTKAVVAPTLLPGIDRMAVTEDDQEVQSITKEDAGYFDEALTDGTIINETVTKQVLQLIKADYVGGKWRLHNGTNKLNYAIEDPVFASEVRTGARRTGAGDYIIGQVRTVQRIDAAGELHNEHSLIKVDEYRTTPPIGQVKLL